MSRRALPPIESTANKYKLSSTPHPDEYNIVPGSGQTKNRERRPGHQGGNCRGLGGGSRARFARSRSPSPLTRTSQALSYVQIRSVACPVSASIVCVKRNEECTCMQVEAAATATLQRDKAATWAQAGSASFHGQDNHTVAPEQWIPTRAACWTAQADQPATAPRHAAAGGATMPPDMHARSTAAATGDVDAYVPSCALEEDGAMDAWVRCGSDLH